MTEHTHHSDGSAAMWDPIDAGARDALKSFVGLVREVFGTHLNAVTFFGPVVVGGFEAAGRTASSAVVVDRVVPTTLRTLAEHGARLGMAGVAAPLIMTPKYIQASLDSFPLELIEIQQQGVTVLGADPFGSLAFEASHVRLQCERELKRALLALRQGLLAAAGRERRASALQRDAADPLLRTLRGLLWLKGRREFVASSEVVGEMERLAERKLGGLKGALTSAAPGWPAFDALYADVETLMEIVDAW